MRVRRRVGHAVAAALLVSSALPAAAHARTHGLSVAPSWAQSCLPDAFEFVGDDTPAQARDITTAVASAGSDYTEEHTIDSAASAPPFYVDEDWFRVDVSQGAIAEGPPCYTFEAIPIAEPTVFPVVEVYGPFEGELPVPHDPLVHPAPAIDASATASGLGGAWFDHMGTSVVLRPDAAGSYYVRVRPYGDDSGSGYRAEAGEYEFRAKTGTFVRLAGPDRYGTAAAVSRERFADAMLDGALGYDNLDTVVLASGENYPDALAGSFLAGVVNGPILLTRTSSLPDVTAEEIVRLTPDRVIVLGGEGAVAPEVPAAIQALFPSGEVPEVVRFAGQDRIETAVRIAEDGADILVTESGGGVPRGCVIADARNFPDALSASSAAAGGLLPIFLTGSDSLDARVETAMKQMSMTDAVIVGGTGAVSSAVQTRLEKLLGSDHVVRLAGSDRYETSARFAAWLVGLDSGGATVGTPGTPDLMPAGRMLEIGVATGANFPDALSAGPSCGRGAPSSAAPLLLSPPQAMSPWIYNLGTSSAGPGYLDRVWSRLGGESVIDRSVIFGGSGAIPDATWIQLDEKSAG